MSSKVRKSQTSEHKQSRAALTTIEMSVGAVADAFKQLSTLQEQLYQAHLEARATFQVARHHALKGRDLRAIEEFAGELAERFDWPEGLAARAHCDHLERPLTDDQSWEIGRCAASAFAVTDGMLTVSGMVEELYGTLVESAANAARSAMPKATAAVHRREATKLMLRLDQLCADERLEKAVAFAASARDEAMAPAFAGEPASDDDEEDTDAQCGRPTGYRLH